MRTTEKKEVKIIKHINPEVNGTILVIHDKFGHNFSLFNNDVAHALMHAYSEEMPELVVLYDGSTYELGQVEINGVDYDHIADFIKSKADEEKVECTIRKHIVGVNNAVDGKRYLSVQKDICEAIEVRKSDIEKYFQPVLETDEEEMF